MVSLNNHWQMVLQIVSNQHMWWVVNLSWSVTLLVLQRLISQCRYDVLNQFYWIHTLALLVLFIYARCTAFCIYWGSWGTGVLLIQPYCVAHLRWRRSNNLLAFTIFSWQDVLFLDTGVLVQSYFLFYDSWMIQKFCIKRER